MYSIKELDKTRADLVRKRSWRMPCLNWPENCHATQFINRLAKKILIEGYQKHKNPEEGMKLLGILLFDLLKLLALSHSQLVAAIVIGVFRVALDPVQVNGVFLAQVQQPSP